MCPAAPTSGRINTVRGPDARRTALVALLPIFGFARPERRSDAVKLNAEGIEDHAGFAKLMNDSFCHQNSVHSRHWRSVSMPIRSLRLADDE